MYRPQNILTLVTVVIAVVALVSSPVLAAIGLVVDGETLSPDVPPQLIEGRTLVPLRFVGDALGLEVSWDAAAQSAVLEGTDLAITLPVDEQQATVNGEPVTLDVPATIIEGRTMVPLRFVSDQLGAAVAWDGTTELVTVTTTDTPPDDGTEEPTPAVDPTDPTTLTGRYAMTGDALVVFPGQSEPQELPVSGWFDLVVEAGAADHNAYKSGLEGSLDGLVIPEAVAMEADAVDVESVSVELELDPDAVQSGSYDASSGEFWMVTTLAVEFPALGALAGPYQGIALEQGTLDSSTAAYSSTVSLSITSGPFAGVCAIFSKNGDREDSLDDIRELLEKDELTEEEKERVRDYLRESNASEADKIEVLKDLIDLAQKATGETLVITPLEVLEAIIAGLKNIEEQFYQNYKQMRDAGLIDGPEGFPNGTLRVRQKYEMRYLLEQLKDKLD